jgi:hypothetical protein
MTPGNGNDYLIEDGDVSGRKITTFEKLNITADGNGISRHVVLSLSGVIRYVTICVAEDIEIGDLISFPSFKHEIADLT